MKITEEQISAVIKKVRAKYRNITKQMFENGVFASEKYIRELQKQEMQEMEDEIAKLKAQ